MIRGTILLLFIGCTVHVGSQEIGSGSLQQSFRAILEQHNRGKPVSFDDLRKIDNQIVAAAPNDITAALPILMEALASSDLETQIDAAAELITIGTRADAGDLLRGHFQQLAFLFHSPDGRLQGTPIYVISELRPPVPDEVKPLLLEFLEESGRDAKAQPGALQLLIRMAPHDPQVIAASKRYFEKQHDKEALINTLSALRGLQTTDAQFIASIVDTLNNPDKGVRFTALQVIPTMGRNVLIEAEPILRKMIVSPDETDENKALAEQDLKEIERR